MNPNKVCPAWQNMYETITFTTDKRKLKPLFSRYEETSVSKEAKENAPASRGDTAEGKKGGWLSSVLWQKENSKRALLQKRYKAFLSKMTDLLHLKLLYLASKLEIAKSASVMIH